MPLPTIPKMSSTFMASDTDPAAQFGAVRTDIQNTTLYFSRLNRELDQQQADQNQSAADAAQAQSDALTSGLDALRQQAQANLDAGISGIFPVTPDKGGTGIDTSDTTGIPVVISGIWSVITKEDFLTDLIVLDNTAEDVSTSHHGFAPKAPGDATKYLNGDTPPTYALVKDSDLSLSDIAVNNVDITKHGFAPKSPNNAVQFLNGANPPVYAAVKDSDLALTDIPTNDVSSARHGFAPKAPADATKFLNGANPPVYAQIKDSDLVYTTGTFVATGTGFVVNPQVVATWIRIGPLKILHIPQLTGTSNSTSFTITGLPSAIFPGTANGWVYPATDNGAPTACYVFAAAGIGTLGLAIISPSGAWTASGVKGFTDATIVY